MDILLTGASSFTGYWFVTELTRAGHHVTAVFTKREQEYSSMRAKRVRQLDGVCRRIFACQFGDKAFCELARGHAWNLFCHHAADVTNYRSPDFNISAALATNTAHAESVLIGLQERGCSGVLLTGSVFEPGEGAGSDKLRAVSPYGLSKGLTAEVFEYYCSRSGIDFAKFTIPNPFGPYEEPRFTTYLAQTWLAGRPAVVRTPDYVRDNIHVGLLAKAYVQFAEQLRSPRHLLRLNPSGYVESQRAFTLRFAGAMSERLGVQCEVSFQEQNEFDEPLVRVNTDRLDLSSDGWDEALAWDELADFYRGVYSPPVIAEAL